MSKHRWLTRCRNRAASGPTRYVLDFDGLRVVVPRRVLLMKGPELVKIIQSMADDYRRRLGL